MKNINSYRVFRRNNNEINSDGNYVLYCMSANRRLHYNFALEYAIAWANKLNKPLLIYEGLSCGILHACDRFHQFLIEGMHENCRDCSAKNTSYYSFIEFNSGDGKGLVQELAAGSCLVVADEFPAYIIPAFNRLISTKVKVPYITIDSNGLIPLSLTEKAPYSAYIFRMIMQKHFKEAYLNPPVENPLAELKNRTSVRLPTAFLEKYPDAAPHYANIPDTVSKLAIDHSIKALEINGTRKSALAQLEKFINTRISRYKNEKNDPDAEVSSGLSGWLHYGKISEYEIVLAALNKQPHGWSLDDIKYKKGQRDGYFGGDPGIEVFLDELITWREVGYHYCHHVPNYDKFGSLPDWAIKTLEQHASDKREYLYTFEQFEKSLTHDEIWNAAQRQLVREGKIHGYLRMIWGKKLLEWTENPHTALKYLIELNNKYAIDGHDPNSYSGIFWIFGRFDRAWGPERPVYGKIRYMSSINTAKKIKLKSYLKKFAAF